MDEEPKVLYMLLLHLPRYVPGRNERTYLRGVYEISYVLLTV